MRKCEGTCPPWKHRIDLSLSETGSRGVCSKSSSAFRGEVAISSKTSEIPSRRMRFSIRFGERENVFRSIQCEFWILISERGALAVSFSVSWYLADGFRHDCLYCKRGASCFNDCSFFSRSNQKPDRFRLSRGP